LIRAEIVISWGCRRARISLLAPGARARGWPNSLVTTFSRSRLEPHVTNAGGSRSWWRRWWVWAAVALAMIALFLPVLR
jgi:hypothetical protein